MGVTATVSEGELVVAGGDATPLLENLKVPFDDGAAFVGRLVEGGWAATSLARTAQSSALGDEVVHRNGRVCGFLIDV